MSRLRYFLTDSRTLSILGLLALVAFFFLGASTLEIALLWAAAATAAVLLLWLAVWAWRRIRHHRASQGLAATLEEQAERAARDADASRKADIEALRKRMSEAVRTIRTSRLGQRSGYAALYELPWYMIIGNPAAGKSSAVLSSGLNFPFADDKGNAVQGIGGTRNCDWFFTTEGILLDTAGRYSVQDEDRREWLGFLDLLKKHRRKAPINGVIVAASIAELTGSRPEFAIDLAKNLRQRVQELTERLEVFAPVYVIFTKADLITGFSEFFQDADWNERNRIWGATLRFDPHARTDAIAEFDRHFDELYEGLREMSVAQMAAASGGGMPPGLLTFPAEFTAMKPALRSFIATLFEDNPFQFRPIFRGFYFTSALQEGASRSASSERIAQRFGLRGEVPPPARVASRHGFFLKDLFSRVVFEDRQLVRQYASRSKLRWRYAAFLAAVCTLGIALGGWTWSYIGNRQLLANVHTDLAHAVRLQDGRIDLQSRLEALEVLQDRIAQLERLRTDRPLSLGLGLYQGEHIEETLRREYFNGMRSIMLEPVAERLEAFLLEANTRVPRLQPQDGAPAPAPSGAAAGTPYAEATPDSVEDAYNALKTYLMLATPEHAEVAHLSDQVTRFWRGWLEANRGTMSREQMIRSAEKLLSFHLAHAATPGWPAIQPNLALVDQTRDNLRRVVRGLPARDRVYAEIKARASTRYPAITVAGVIGDEDAALIGGSRLVSGAFTRDAWKQFVEPAIRDAANNALQSADWVLKTSMRDDLSLEGSPEQIQKALVARYKGEYAAEWRNFLKGITVADFGSFDEAVARANRIGDTEHSPLARLVTTIHEQTSWDNPSAVNAGLERAQRGFVNWFKSTILRMNPTRVAIEVDVQGREAGVPMGAVGREFAGLNRLVAPREDGHTLFGLYLKQLSGLRTRLNLLKNQGDPGPGAVQLMRQTLEGSGSELAETLRFVDEQMLAGLTDEQRQALRPLLVRPLLQTYAAIARPAESELNRVWKAQVFAPFERGLAAKYPFDAQSRVEATPAEIAVIFGPDGAIANYLNTTLGPLVVRRGDTLNARTWGDVGVNIDADFAQGFAGWIDPLAAGGPAGGSEGPQTVFQILPQPAPGTTEYTIEIDGQRLRYRNTQSQWTNFVWPNPQGSPGARISAVAFDGRTVEVANHPGRFGLERLINSAQKQRQPQGNFALSWSQDDVTVAIELRIISNAQGDGSGETSRARGLTGTRLPANVVGTRTSQAGGSETVPARAVQTGPQAGEDA